MSKNRQLHLSSLRPRTSIAVAVSFALWGAQALAQETTELEEVVVTGSFIQGTPEDAAQPVETITFEELQNVGRPSNLEMVKLMSEVGQVAGETDRYNSFPVGAATVNLRNLGQRFTTVIFNGRRFPEQYSPVTGRFNNIAWIPNAVVGSVEVLKGGGAVTYGADAVAGVVNYITRKDVDGLELNADYRYIEDSDGDYNADIIWGTQFDRGNLLLSAAYQHRSNLRAWDRDWARQPFLMNNNSQAWGIANSPGGYAFQMQTVPGSYLSVLANPALPAAYRFQGDRQIGASGIVRDNNCDALGGWSGFSSTGSPACYFQQAQFEKLVEESDTFQFYAELNYDITDSVQYTGEFLAYDITLPDIAMHPSDAPLSYPLAPATTPGGLRPAQNVNQSNVYYVSGANPGVRHFLENFRSSNGTTAYTQPQIDAIVASGRALLPQFFWRPFATGGNPLYGDYDVQENSTRFYRTTQALGGDLPEFGGSDLRWDVALTYNYVEDRREARDMLVDRLQNALNGFGGPNCAGPGVGVAGTGGCEWFNPFSSSFSHSAYTGAPNPAYRADLTNSNDLVRWLYVPIWLEREYEYFVADVLFSGKTGWELPGGPVAVALGAQYRRATEETNLSDEANRDINPCATLGATDCASQTGALAFTRNSTVLGATVESDRKFPVYAAFAEAQLPLLDALTLQMAGRYERFISDLSDRDNDVFVPSASLRWQATDWMALRGTWGRTFSQVNPPAPEDPTIGSSGAIAAFGGFGAGPGQTFSTANYPNLDVEPMKGSYVNLGLLFEAGGFRGSFDLYDVRIDDYARTMSVTNVVNGLVMPGQTGVGALINCSSPLLAPQAGLDGRAFVELNGACVQGSSALNSAAGLGGLAGGRVNYFGGTDETNAGELMTRGIDVSMSYAFDIAGAQLRPFIDGSYVLDWELEAFSIGGTQLAPGYDGVGFVNNTSTGRIGQAVPEWRATFGVNFSYDIHNLNIAAHVLPSIRDEDPSKFNESNRNSSTNVGDANGFVNPACADTNPTTPPIPANAGTGQFGGFCQGQVASILSGQKIDGTVTVDMTYRVQLPAETAMSLSVFNLTDEDPSFARTAISYMSGFGSPLGRNVKLQLSKRF